MQSNCQPLISRTSPLPGESLLSLLVRLTERNSYEALSLLRGLIFDRPSSLQPLRDSLEFPTKTSTYDRLVSLTLLDDVSLYQCTPHRFASILTPPSQKILYAQLPGGNSVPFFPKGLFPKQLRPQHSAQFCPSCLAEKAYYTLRWTPIAISTCLKHESLLVDRCHECHHGVSIMAIATGRCERCQAELSKAKTTSICRDALGLLTQQILQNWFMDLTTPFSTVLLLPQQPARLLYWVVEDLQSFLRTARDGSWNYLHHLEKHEELPRAVPLHEDQQLPSPYESYRLYTAACKSIIHWPDGFFDFLNHYGSRNAQTLYPALQTSQPRRKGKLIPGILSASLGPLYTQWLPQRWKHPEYDFIREAFNDYIADNYWFSDLSELKSFCRKNPEHAKRCTYASMDDAADFLNLSLEAIEFLVGGDQVPSASSGEDSAKYVKREAVFALQDAQRRSIPLSGVVMRLGLSKEVIKYLVKAGLFSEGESPERDFAAEDVSAIGEALFLRKILQHTKALLPGEMNNERDHVNLLEADRLLSVAGLNIATLFLLMLDSKLCAYVQPEHPLKLSHLLFLCTDIQTLTIKYASRRFFLLEEEKVANILGVQKEILAQWTRKGLITPEAMYGRGLFFETVCIDQFRHRYIFGGEATELLGLNANVMTNPIWSSPASLSEICAGGFDLHKGDRCIFDREKLTRWREDRLTIDESSDILGQAEATLPEWIREVKIAQVDFINDEPTWLLKQEVLHVTKSTYLYDAESYNKGDIRPS
jgi:hypothetical protein